VDYLLPFAAGGFIYIAASDLIPELHKEEGMKKIAGIAVFLLAILFMYAIKVYGGE
jgi:zinc and cadmium transporter